jgi:hypothetical protein
MKKIPALLLSLAAAACDSQFEEQPKSAPVRLPAQVCRQAADGIKKLNESGGFDYRGGGEGTLEEQAWLQMDERQRDSLMKLLAYDAACTAKDPPAEATATLRNETGRVLSQQVVETDADPSKMLQD